MKHARPDYQKRIVDLEHLIPEDEPVLLIRGQDEFASEMNEHYLSLVRGKRISLEEQAADAKDKNYDEEAADLLEEADELLKIEEALTPHGRLIRAWPKKKSPDLAPPEDED